MSSVSRLPAATHPTIRRSRSLRVRLGAAFVLVAVLTAAMVSIASILTARQALIDVVGSNLHTLASDQAVIVNEVLDRQFTALSILSASQGVVASAEIGNLQYPGSPASIRTQLERREQEWQAADDTAGIVQSRIAGAPVSTNLTLFQKLQPDSLRVILVDGQGGLVAATSRPARYDQSGERWWQQTVSGSPYIDQVVDPVTNMIQLRLAVPVMDLSGSRTVGALLSIYQLDRLIAQLASVQEGTTQGALLQLSDGQILTNQALARPADADALAALQTSNADYRIGDFDGRRRVLSIAPVGIQPPISELGWNILLYQDEAAALAPVNAARNTGILAAVGAMIVAGLVAFGVASLIVNPLARMAAAAQAIAAGQLDRRVGFRRDDEIGQLARSFDVMAESLEQRIAAEQHAQEERIRLQNDIIRVQEETLRELETPCIPLNEAVLLLPLIGTITRQRADQIFSDLLGEVSRRRARRVIIDVTGISTIDDHVAETLLRAADGVRLLGAEVVLTGIRAGVAQTLVSLDAPLSRLTVAANLESALTTKYVLR